MNFKLAIKNVKKSFQSYGIYFLTLSFAICIFYAFNSVDAQEKILGADSGNRLIMERLTMIINYISIFVSVILGCLIIYANNFLIKKRKKELGLYMSLGMSKRKISTILVCEEFIIGFLSLICGLISGFVLSQGLAILSSSIFAIELVEFNIIFSKAAMIKSIAYFGVIFITVMIFNIIVISKYKLIDLLLGDKKNQKIKIKNPIVGISILILSIIILVLAYKIIIDKGLMQLDKYTLIPIILGCIGTVLFFYSITGIIALILEKNQKIYYKKLNIFTARQINSKINTNFISMSVICLMLFITICMLSLAVGFKNRELDRYSPFDMSITATIENDKELKFTEELFGDAIKNVGGQSMELRLMNAPEKNIIDEGIQTNNKGNSMSAQKELREVDFMVLKNILEPYADNELKKDFGFEVYAPYFININDYNKYLKMRGQKEVTLNEKEYLLISNVDSIKDDLERFLNEGEGKLIIDGETFKPKTKEIINENIDTGSMGNWYMIFVGNDSMINKGKIERKIYNIDYGVNKNKIEELLNKLNLKVGYNYIEMKGLEDGVDLRVSTREEIQSIQSMGTIMMLYVSLYVGAIFLISSAAILALQQLSEANDSKKRYIALKKIGASESQINKSIFIQILVYFAAPLILAIIHSVVGIYIGNEVLIEFGKSEVLESAFVATSFITVIYGAYFFITYCGYKESIKN